MSRLSFGVPAVISRWKQRNARRSRSVLWIFATYVPGAAWKRSAPLQTKRAEVAGSPSRERRDRSPRRRDHTHLPPDEVSGLFVEPIESPYRQAILDSNVLPLDVTCFGKTTTECSQERRRRPGRHWTKKPHHRHPRLLSARRERPRRSAAEKRDQLAAVHSINSSARPESGSGTVRPSALAVLR